MGTLLVESEVGLFGEASSQINAELRRIYGDLHLGAKHANISTIIADLERLKIITPHIADLTKRLLSAFDTVENGRSLAPQQVDLVRDKGPSLVRILRSVPS